MLGIEYQEISNEHSMLQEGINNHLCSWTFFLFFLLSTIRTASNGTGT